METIGVSLKTSRLWTVILVSGLGLIMPVHSGHAQEIVEETVQVNPNVELFKKQLQAKRGLQVGQGGASRVDMELAKIKQEPTVRQVQEAALRNFQVNTEQVNSMRSRASMKAIVPVLEISGGYAASDMSESTDHYEYNFFPWISRGADGTGYDVRGKLAWNLPQLIFNAEELDVASLAGLVEGLLKESTRLYFMRRRLQIEIILNPPKERASMLTKELRLEELTGLIDAMTGGWFQKELDGLKGR